MRTPLVVVTGVDPVAMDTTLMSLAWDVPRAVSVRHRIDPHSQVLTRTVSDTSGILEQEHIQLEHACVSCALREDIMPTLERLARADRWGAIVSGLPAATEAGQLAHILATDSRLARRLRLSSVVAAVGTGDVVQDLLSDDLLRERGVHTHPDDERGVGEVACAQIEFADVVVLEADPGAEASDLVRALARPGVPLVTGADQLDDSTVTSQRHQYSLTNAWCSPELEVDLPALGPSHAWRLDLSSPRPFHPDRLLDQVERLGAGTHRSRGSFWVPTRPGDVLEWSGAGGQLSIGTYSPWGRRAPATRLIFTGLGTPPHDLVAAFEDLLLTPTEALLDHRSWAVLEDGLEPWLGDIRDAA
ncbi:cobalamin biosynthesis protein CobW [Nocardioides gansuensis]|uniref:Cobalamin biosynthesis protein CobW n=1 Tax=Nocardioides gansuensis TaxID=2138300 RepID=A0A2T8FD52_9ACTN|nr:GTP-binding protein [Nocardioides gansuensis]PVG83634.1 cobalamin biosynthesis protein CobW [Nocardioides gansuensis]